LEKDVLSHCYQCS